MPPSGLGLRLNPNLVRLLGRAGLDEVLELLGLGFKSTGKLEEMLADVRIARADIDQLLSVLAGFMAQGINVLLVTLC